MNKSKNEKNVYILYIWKKIRDSKIRTKLTVYLVLVAIICSTVIGSISYLTMRKTLMDTVEDSAISLLKQAGTQMEERIREFQETSYSFANTLNIYELLDNKADGEKNLWQYTLNQEKLTEAFLSYTVLHNYSDFMILELENEEIYYYDQAVVGNKITRLEADEIMDDLRDEVSILKPIKWVKRGDRIFFVRKVLTHSVSKNIKVLGIAVFAISDAFFELDDKKSIYVSNQNLVVCGKDGAIYKNNGLKLDEAALNPYLSYKDGKYYIYAAMREISREKYLVIPMRTIEFQWNILCFISYSVILEKANQMIPKILITTLLLLAAGLCLGFILYRMLKKNLEIIEKGMHQYETGDYSTRLSPVIYDEIGYLILQFNHMGLKINELNEIARKEEEEKQLLEYQVMEAQINPHFLYNTLGSLKWLAYEKEQEEIVKLTDAIINLLRFTVKHVNQFIMLKEELDYVRQYIYIQQTRYENTFQVEIDVTKDAEAFVMIGFVLQPFIENSILHGLDIARTDGMIRINGEIKRGSLVLIVSDNGFGMTEEKLLLLQRKIEEDKAEKYKGFNGIGITNIILRLKMIYGTEFQYQIESAPGKGTSVTLNIPERKTEDEKKSIDC